MTIEEMPDKTFNFSGTRIRIPGAVTVQTHTREADGSNPSPDHPTSSAPSHLTGHLTTNSTAFSGGRQIHWYNCGDRCGGSTSWNSWKEAEVVLVKK